MSSVFRHITTADMTRVHNSAIQFGYRQGYAAGFTAGEQYAHLTDEQFLDALVRRVRAADVLEDHIQQTLKAALAAQATRKLRTKGEAA